MSGRMTAPLGPAIARSLEGQAIHPSHTFSNHLGEILTRKESYHPLRPRNVLVHRFNVHIADLFGCRGGVFPRLP